MCVFACPEVMATSGDPYRGTEDVQRNGLMQPTSVLVLIFCGGLPSKYLLGPALPSYQSLACLGYSFRVVTKSHPMSCSYLFLQCKDHEAFSNSGKNPCKLSELSNTPTLQKDAIETYRLPFDRCSLAPQDILQLSEMLDERHHLRLEALRVNVLHRGHPQAHPDVTISLQQGIRPARPGKERGRQDALRGTVGSCCTYSRWLLQMSLLGIRSLWGY